ncbi:hypothetical protein QFC24_004565 [Naganishia onofrii]|uniref:Uncharacterized protein n=1 Tax=Naganishia onofrii TaxID=1851511 RepID=A0ACC2XGY1_9TREE|nr:hypothetical protein QFC24_004565 [Naganishia onofrii]
MVVETYLSLSKDRKCTLVYALNYKHTRDLLSAFRQAGVRARSLTGFSTSEERNITLADFAQGEFSVLIGSLLLVESASMPSVSNPSISPRQSFCFDQDKLFPLQVDCIFLARPTRLRIAFAQMVGRARLQAILQNRTKGNDAASLHDFAISEEESPIIEAGSAKELVHYEEEAAPFHASDGEDPFSRDCPEGRKARRMSRYAWVCCGTGRYILPISSEDCLSVTLVDQTFVIKWEGWVTRYLFFSRNEKIQIGHASDPHAAFGAADVMLEESLTRPGLAK